MYRNQIADMMYASREERQGLGGILLVKGRIEWSSTVGTNRFLGNGERNVRTIESSEIFSTR